MNEPMTINESIMYLFLVGAVAVCIVIMAFDKLRGWFWGWYDRYKRLHQKRRD